MYIIWKKEINSYVMFCEISVSVNAVGKQNLHDGVEMKSNWNWKQHKLFMSYRYFVSLLNDVITIFTVYLLIRKSVCDFANFFTYLYFYKYHLSCCYCMAGWSMNSYSSEGFSKIRLFI